MPGKGRWQPKAVSDGFLGFCLSGVPAALDEACRRLQLKQLARPKRGHFGRNAGVKVRTAEGAICWLKVGGAYSPANRFFQGEVEAGGIEGLPKPALIANAEWSRDFVTWGARLVTWIDQSTVERNPWAVAQARHMHDDWLLQLRGALAALSAWPTRRLICDPRQVRAVLRDKFGIEEPPRTEWHTAHGDLHWSNVTEPDLVLLDWEAWGLAPPGYDIAMMIAYSAHDATLVARLEQVFADMLSRRSVRATRVYVLNQFLHSIDDGWLDPELRAPVSLMLANARRAWSEEHPS